VDLVERGIVRVLDVHMVQKDVDGTVSSLEIKDLDRARVWRSHRRGVRGRQGKDPQLISRRPVRSDRVWRLARRKP